MSEETLIKGAQSIKVKIKMALIQREMTQVELSKLLQENPQQVNRAISGDMSPKSLEIRQKVYKVLGIKD